MSPRDELEAVDLSAGATISRALRHQHLSSTQVYAVATEAECRFAVSALRLPAPALSRRCGGGECVEVNTHGGVLVRDSKDPGGPVLAFAPAAWRRFLGWLR